MFDHRGTENSEGHRGEDLNTLSAQIIGAAIAVHQALGPGFSESLYEEALCVEMQAKAVPYARQVPVSVRYREREIGIYRLDILAFSRIIIELKAVDSLTPMHQAQALAYLRATNLELALIINFNASTLTRGVKRVINAPNKGPH